MFWAQRVEQFVINKGASNIDKCFVRVIPVLFWHLRIDFSVICNLFVDKLKISQVWDCINWYLLKIFEFSSEWYLKLYFSENSVIQASWLIGNTSASYLGGLSQKFWPRYWLSWLRFSWFSCPFRQMAG